MTDRTRPLLRGDTQVVFHPLESCLTRKRKKNLPGMFWAWWAKDTWWTASWHVEVDVPQRTCMTSGNAAAADFSTAWDTGIWNTITQNKNIGHTTMFLEETGYGSGVFVDSLELAWVVDKAENTTLLTHSSPVLANIHLTWGTAESQVTHIACLVNHLMKLLVPL